MKFKNIKKNLSGGKKNPKSPSNSRSIPAFAKASSGKPAFFFRIYELSLKAFLILVFLLAVVIVGIDLQKNIIAKKNTDREREVLTQELKFWESFIDKHKDYRDAYFKASILEYKLGNTFQAKIYADKGLSLDPNSENGKKLKQFLVNDVNK